MTVKSVRKKLKRPSFAAAVSREELSHGAAALGVELDVLIGEVIEALGPHAGELGVPWQQRG
jgi:predicted hydrolase (HD superfamily)